MVDLQQEGVELLFEQVERKGRLTAGSRCAAVEVAQEHLVHSTKEPLDATTTLWLARGGKYEPDL